MRYLPFFIAGWVSFGCAAHTGLGVTDRIREEWEAAVAGIRAGVVNDGYKRTAPLHTQSFRFRPMVVGDPASINISDYRFIEISKPFDCGPLKDKKYVGCFHPHDKTILYLKGERGVIIHEAAHAILYQLGDPRWWCVLHDKNKNGVWDCEE